MHSKMSLRATAWQPTRCRRNIIASDSVAILFLFGIYCRATLAMTFKQRVAPKANRVTVGQRVIISLSENDLLSTAKVQ